MSTSRTAAALDTAPFEVSHLAVGLKQRSARGAAVTLISQSLKFLVQLGGTAVMARLVTPQDYGLIGMVSAVTGILLVFGNFGLSSAIIQQPHVNQRQMSTLFWLNTALGLGLTFLVAALAPGLAWFYKDPRLLPVTIYLGLGFLISGLGVQHNALLKRQMRFGTLSAVEISSSVVSTAVGIVFAMLHYGYWSLVIMQLSSSITFSTMSWIACRWRPGLPSRNSGIRSMVVFGGNLTFFNALNYFVRNFDNVLIGWRWGPGILGQYSKAYNLLTFPLSQINGPISNVAVPALSRLQNDPDRYRSYYLKGLKLLAYATMPLIIVLGVYSQEIIYLVLGPQWAPAANLFRILAFAAILQPIGSATGWLFTSLNRADVMARWGLISGPCFVLSFIIGLPWGAAGVATSYSIVGWLLSYTLFKMAVADTPVSLRDVVSAVSCPLAVGIVSGLTMAACRAALPQYGILWRSVFSASAGVFIFFVMRQFSTVLRTDIADIVMTVRAIKQSEA